MKEDNHNFDSIYVKYSEKENLWSHEVDYWLPSGEGNGTPLQYFCLENPMDGGAW